MNEVIMDHIAKGNFTQIKSELIRMNAVDIAQLLEEVEGEKLLVVFRLLPKDTAAQVFSYLSSERQEYIINSITDKELKVIIDELFLDDTVDLLEEMPANVVKKVLKNAGEDRRKLINQFLNYPDESAGSIMTIEFVDLKKEMTVKQAIEHIKRTGVDKETIDICYVIDNNCKLEGIVSLRKLILSSEETIVKDIMYTNIISIFTHDDQEDIASLFKRYDFLAMPVVDKENRLVGIITIDDIVDIIEQENTEDFQKMAAMQPSEGGYLETGVFGLAKIQIIWLLVLMISLTLTSIIIRRFENVLESVVVLAAFIPMLMGTGGNVGSQSSTLVIRGMALGQINLKDIFSVIWKELRVSVIVGTVLATVNFARIYFFETPDIKVAAVVSVSMLLTVVMAKIIGGALPIVAKWIKLDPAIMAIPMITTIVDAMALTVYFYMATWLLGI